MAGGDGGLHGVRAVAGPAQLVHAPSDEHPVPRRAVLVGEEDRHAVAIRAGGQA